MSQANAGGKNNPANRGIGGHIKEGLKNVPKMYGALYNAKGPTGAKMGVKNTVGSNVRTVVTGKPAPGIAAKPAAQRAKIGAAGAASVTPLGPAVAIGLGIKKSMADKAAAKAAMPKPAPKPLSPVQKAQQKKADDMKKVLNEALPGANFKTGKR